MKKFICLGLFCAAALAPAALAQPADYQFVPAGAQKLVPDRSGFYAQAMLGRHDDGIAMITTRDKSGEAESHAQWNDYIFVQDGEASMLLGGSIQTPRTVSSGEIRGSGLSGAKTIALHAGDYLYIPVTIAHRMVLAPGKTIRYAVVKTRR